MIEVICYLSSVFYIFMICLLGWVGLHRAMTGNERLVPANAGYRLFYLSERKLLSV
jgi:hypothetical protein